MSARPQGLRVYCPTKPDWGVGHALADDGGAKVTVYFLRDGKRTLDTTIADLDLATGNAAMNTILDVAAQTNWQHAHHNLYVVELRPEIFQTERRFFEKNPHWLPGKLCAYVGMSSGTFQSLSSRSLTSRGGRKRGRGQDSPERGAR